jgi:cellulose synthase/poly-beta-1,6-N-acetylglucosamine synthase-like glycosyltransferase
MRQVSQGSAERSQKIRHPFNSSSKKSAPANSTPTFSVIICTHDRGQELERCLDGISRQNYSYFDVLVVDSAPQDAVAFEIARRWGVLYVMEPKVGLSRARNLGVRVSTGEIVAFLDDDAVPDPNWLQNLAAEFKDPQVAAVAGRIQELRSTDEPPNEVGEFYSLDCLGDQRRRVDRENLQWFEIANFGGIGQGSNMAFRRSGLHSWPGFEHRLGRGSRISGSEEHYAFFRLIERGHRVVYAPDASVYHPYPADLPILRRHQLRHLAASTGYLTFLFFEAPNHRRQLIRYVFEALRGVRRTWRSASRRCPPRLVSRCRSYSALLLGPLLYLRTQLESALALKAYAPAVSGQLSTATMLATDGEVIRTSLRQSGSLAISRGYWFASQEHAMKRIPEGAHPLITEAQAATGPRVAPVGR